jgi:hypothetical protein
MTMTVKKYMAVRKAAWGRIGAGFTVKLRGGPIAGYMKLHDCNNTLPFTLGGVTGQYSDGQWVSL